MPLIQVQHNPCRLASYRRSKMPSFFNNWRKRGVSFRLPPCSG